MKRLKICVDPGHGGPDPGASYRGLQEKWVVMRVALLMKLHLENLGHQVMLTRGYDWRPSLVDRATKANEWQNVGADLFVSIHTNADADDDDPGDAEAMGSEIWIYKAGRPIAEALVPAMERRLLGERFRGIKVHDFTVLTATKMPAVLVEIGFIDASETCRRFHDLNVLDDIAEALGDGLHSYSKT